MVSPVFINGVAMRQDGVVITIGKKEKTMSQDYEDWTGFGKARAGWGEPANHVFNTQDNS
jgi:hypothetical protein